MIEGHDYTIYCNGPCGRSRMYALLALITAFLTPLAQHGVLFLLRIPDWTAAAVLPLGPVTYVLENAYLWAYVALVVFLPTWDAARGRDYVSVASSSPS